MACDNRQPLGGAQDLDKPLALPCQDQQLHILLMYIWEHAGACNVKPFVAESAVMQLTGSL